MITETALAVRSNGNIAPEDQAKFQIYLKSHLTDEMVIQVMEELLVEENSTYNAITFEQALKEIQAKDGGRYLILKTLLEGFANKEGLVMVDPKLVTAAFKERMANLEMLKAMSRLRRFLYRLAQAFVGLFSEKGETAAIQEAIQIGGEVQIARRELAAVEIQKKQTVVECSTLKAETAEFCNAMRVTTSDECRQRVLDTNIKLNGDVTNTYQANRSQIVVERERFDQELRHLRDRIDEARQSLVKLEMEKVGVLGANAYRASRVRHQESLHKENGYMGFEHGEPSGPGAYRGYRELGREALSSSRSMSPSQSMSPSASNSYSPSPSPSEGYEE